MIDWLTKNQVDFVWCNDPNLYAKEEPRLPEPTIPGFSTPKVKQKRASKRIFRHPAKGFYLVKDNSFEEFVKMTGCECH